MADLESKLMGEKTVSYISDSDEEDVIEEPSDQVVNDNLDDLSNPYEGPQTGPKGVLEDYKQYKNLCRLEEAEAVKEKIALHKKLAFTADPNKHPSKETKENEESDDEFDFEDDEFMKEYHEKRIAQLRKEMEEKITKSMPQFGSLIDLKLGGELLDVIEKEDKSVVIIVHIYDSKLHTCLLMNNCLQCLAQQYKHIKFCKIQAANAGLSLHFKLNALPALQIYKGGSLIGNFIKMQEYLDKIFYTADVENFLIESDILTGVQGAPNNYDDYDVIED